MERVGDDGSYDPEEEYRAVVLLAAVLCSSVLNLQLLFE